MHETFMAQQIASELERVTAPYQPCRLTRVTLKVGVLRQVVADLLRFALEVATRGTSAEGAEWVVETVKARGRCNRCGREFTVEDWIFLCPACESGDVTGCGGDDLIIENVTLEQEDSAENGRPQPARD